MRKLVNKAILILTRPRLFFEGLKKEKKNDWIKYLVIMSFVYSLVTLTAQVLFANLFQIPAVTIFVAFITQLATIIASSLFFIIIIHLWSKLWKGNGNLKNTARLVTYTNTPVYLFSWLSPVAAQLAGFWLLIIGTQEVHGIQKVKSYIMYSTFVIGIMAIFALMAVYAVPGGA